MQPPFAVIEVFTTDIESQEWNMVCLAWLLLAVLSRDDRNDGTFQHVLWRG